MQSIVGRSPLALFLVLGAGVFALDRGLDRGDAERRVIAVTDEQVAAVRARWGAQWGREPTAPELERLLDEAVREEILYREAQRLALDRDDPIVRRRLAQKMTFLLEDRVERPAPSPDEIRAHYAAHAERYREPRRTTFRHVFLSTDRRSDAERDAERLLEVLGTSAGKGGWRRLGDPFMLLGEYADRTDRELAELFGEPFAAALGELAVGGWRGPVRSAHGVHLVRVLARREARLPDLAAVRERVAADLVEVRAREQNEAAFEALRARYEVRFPAAGSGGGERRQGLRRGTARTPAGLVGARGGAAGRRTAGQASAPQ